MKCRRIPDCGKPEETYLALLAKLLERRHDLTKYLLDTERFLTTGFGDRAVQMKDVDAVATQSR